MTSASKTIAQATPSASGTEARLPTLIKLSISSILATTFAGGVVLFLCFKLLGGGGGVEPTIKMVGYTQAVRVFSLGIPFIGFPIGFLASLYQIWLLIVGGRAVHGLDTTRTAIAVLLPAIVFGALSLVGTIFFGIGLLTSWHMGGG